MRMPARRRTPNTGAPHEESTPSRRGETTQAETPTPEVSRERNPAITRHHKAPCARANPHAQPHDDEDPRTSGPDLIGTIDKIAMPRRAVQRREVYRTDSEEQCCAERRRAVQCSSQPRSLVLSHAAPKTARMEWKQVPQPCSAAERHRAVPCRTVPHRAVPRRTPKRAEQCRAEPSSAGKSFRPRIFALSHAAPKTARMERKQIPQPCKADEQCRAVPYPETCTAAPRRAVPRGHSSQPHSLILRHAAPNMARNNGAETNTATMQSCRAVPCRDVPCRAVPCLAVKCSAVAVPRRVVPIRTLLSSVAGAVNQPCAEPCRAVQCSAEPCAEPGRAAPYRELRAEPNGPVPSV